MQNIVPTSDSVNRVARAYIEAVYISNHTGDAKATRQKERFHAWLTKRLNGMSSENVFSRGIGSSVSTQDAGDMQS